MRIIELLKKLEGTQTIDSVMSILGVDRQKAIYHVHRLRKRGYVKTRLGPSRIRVYSISPDNRHGGTTYYEIINECSPLKLAETETHKIYGREVTPEETIIFAIKSGRFRLLLASLSLFRKIHNWKLLYALAKENGAERKAGALYDFSKLFMRVRRMDGRFRRLMLPKKHDRFQYILEGLRTKEDDFKKIEDVWKVFLPFNRGDMEDYS